MKNNNINIKKYSPFNIEQFKNWLADMKEKNQPKYFEVYVDDFKVVPRTDNPEDFDNHQQYVDDETMKIRVLVYNTQGSNRYMQTIFTLKEPQVFQHQPQQLGEVEVQKKIDEGIDKGLKGLEEKLACEQVKKELLETREELKESKEYAEKLTAYIESLKEKLENAKNIKEVLVAIKEYGPLIFGGKNVNPSLSGAQTEKKPEEQASFKAKSEEEKPALTKEEEHFIQVGKLVEERFTLEELEMVYSVLDDFAKDKAAIKSVREFLNQKVKQ